MSRVLKVSLFWVAAAMILQGCAAVLENRYADIAVKSEEGCNMIEFKKSWIEENVSKIKWSGTCVDGLMAGKGRLELYNKLKPTEILESYDGQMSRGTFEGYGKYMYGKIVKIGTFVDRYHNSSNSGKFYGRRFEDGILKQEGEFAANGNVENGKHFFGTLGYVEGIFIKDRKSTGILSGDGIESGKRYPQAEFTSDCKATNDPKLTPTQKQAIDDTCLYDKKLVEKPPTGGYFQGKVYSAIGELNNAKADFAVAKAERERIEEAQAAERARIEAIAAAERARVQAIADAERNRLQQIENVKQARYTQLRQPCTDARSEAASLRDPELESLKITATTLSVGAIAMAFEKNRDRVVRYKRELEKASADLERQERIFEQAKNRANASADTTCQRAEQAVSNQRNLDDGQPVRLQPTASSFAPAQQTQLSTNSQSDNNEALSTQCTAETNRLLKEGTQAIARGKAQQDANMIRRGMLELARNLQTIISTNEGRCREGKSSVSDRFNALKMLQDVSLACNSGGYGADCERERQQAIKSESDSERINTPEFCRGKANCRFTMPIEKCGRNSRYKYPGGYMIEISNVCNYEVVYKIVMRQAPEFSPYGGLEAFARLRPGQTIRPTMSVMSHPTMRTFYDYTCRTREDASRIVGMKIEIGPNDGRKGCDYTTPPDPVGANR